MEQINIKVINDGGSPVATGHTTSATLSLSADMPEATSKKFKWISRSYSWCNVW